MSFPGKAVEERVEEKVGDDPHQSSMSFKSGLETIESGGPVRRITESDWKQFKKVREQALERFSQVILDESRSILESTSLSAYDRFLKLCKLIEKRDAEMAGTFDDFRRSTALLCLRGMFWQNLLTDEEVDLFSPEVQNVITMEL